MSQPHTVLLVAAALDPARSFIAEHADKSSGRYRSAMIGTTSFPEVDSLVSRTFARAQTPSRRAWLTAARRAVPGDRPTPSPRPVLTATRDFVSRHRSARRGRAPPRALFCPVRGLPPPVAVSSTARHALPDPSYHPVRAADSQHTLDCKTLVAEQRRRTARVCRAARHRYAP